MSRAVRKRKTQQELERATLEELDAEIAYLKHRAAIAGRSVVAKAFRKEIVAAARVRDRRFGR